MYDTLGISETKIGRCTLATASMALTIWVLPFIRSVTGVEFSQTKRSSAYVRNPSTEARNYITHKQITGKRCLGM